jgi:hypothetical protein
MSVGKNLVFKKKEEYTFFKDSVFSELKKSKLSFYSIANIALYKNNIYCILQILLPDTIYNRSSYFKLYRQPFLIKLDQDFNILSVNKIPMEVGQFQIISLMNFNVSKDDFFLNCEPLNREDTNSRLSVDDRYFVVKFQLTDNKITSNQIIKAPLPAFLDSSNLYYEYFRNEFVSNQENPDLIWYPDIPLISSISSKIPEIKIRNTFSRYSLQAAMNGLINWQNVLTFNDGGTLKIVYFSDGLYKTGVLTSSGEIRQTGILKLPVGKNMPEIFASNKGLVYALSIMDNKVMLYKASF